MQDVSAAKYEVRFERDARIPTGEENVSLSADLYLPVGAGARPALVTVLPYRKDVGSGVWYESFLKWFAERGYACVLVDLRGTGSSDGSMRPPYDPDEANDAVAAITWAAGQSWCDGNVGMWGESYGAALTLRAAARQPTDLKAVISVVGMADPGSEWAHPSGARGSHSLARFGALNLVFQLLPPVYHHHSPAEQRRWRDRLESAEPYLVDLYRHGPGDPVWRDRAVDTSQIVVPTLCVSGWRDSLCDGTIRAYERIDAPKRLIMGPWTHTMPHVSPIHPIDFLSVALKWWNQWLCGSEADTTDASIALYVQGAAPGWRSYDSWPPTPDALELAAEPGGCLVTPEQAEAPDAMTEDAEPQILGQYDPDPTIGTLSGLWGISTSGFGLPLDQHDDDLRSLAFTSNAWPQEVLVVGRSRVVVHTLGGSADETASDCANLTRRIVVRLCDVDSRGRSTLITAGVVTTSAEANRHAVELWPTAYRVAAGNRLRVVISDSAFPRLWPLSNGRAIPVVGLEVSVPTAREIDGRPITFPGVSPATPGLGMAFQHHFRITRDQISDAIEVSMGHESTTYTPGREHRIETHSDVRAQVRKDAPNAATLDVSDRTTVHLNTGEEIVVTATARLTSESLWVRGDVGIDGMTLFSRVWRSHMDSQSDPADAG